MPEKLEPLLPDKYYHIYNHATGKENLFETDADYKWFLDKLKTFVTPAFDIFSYSLLPNHFHFIVKIKSHQQIENVFNIENLNKKSIDDTLLSYKLSKQLSNYFNAYAKYFNFTHARKGTLFKRAFRRKPIIGDDYLKLLICYVNRNAVEAGLVINCEDWKNSSYIALISNKETLIKRKQVIELFDERENFIYCCNKKIDVQFDL